MREKSSKQKLFQFQKNHFIERASTFAIYGAGNFGKELFNFVQSKGFTILAFLDRKAIPNQIWKDTPVLLPDSQELTEAQRKNCTVLIAVHNRDVDLLPIISYLKILGFEHILNPVEYYDSFFPLESNRFWLTSQIAYKNLEEEISKTFSLWEDESSQSLYLALLTQRIKGDYSILPRPDQAHQYFPPTIPSWNYPLRFVDCGAYDGDTLLFMKKNKIPVEDVIAFEPDSKIFLKLSQFSRSEWNSSAILFPCGVHSTTTQMHFTSDGGEGGKVSASGDSIIQVVSLDDVVFGFHPNLIKMDIEGAEVDGLLGARKIIERDRPGLAICVYHEPQHLWQIPLMINQWNLGYKFYLRSHAFNGFDTVMYAIASS
jgi:FkbM family methyltransferase